MMQRRVHVMCVLALAALLGGASELRADDEHAAGAEGPSAAHAPAGRAGDSSLFIELFEHLEPHPVTGVWLGGEAGFALLDPHLPDEHGAHAAGGHAPTFADSAAFRAHYAAQMGGGYGFLVYNINTVMWIAALALLLVFVPAARKARARHGQAPRGAFVGAIESLVLFVRDDMVYAVMGKHHGQRFVPLFLTLFFFILALNLLGLTALGSLGGTATANLAVTLGLATISFFWIQFAGIREHGFVSHWKNYVPHVPWWVLPIIVPVELMGVVIKPAALTIRLTANMNAGHLLVLSLFGLIYFANSYLVGSVVWAGAIGIYMLETLVAFVQAYIFTYLTIVFVGATVHPEH